MQFFGQGKPPTGVLFDVGTIDRIDDALALALLHGLDGKNEARIAAICTSSLKAAQFCDIVRSFYLSANKGPFAGFFRGLPFGVPSSARPAADSPMLDVPLAKYPSNIHTLNDTAEPAPLIRNALTAQHDQNAIVVAAGPLTNLASALDLYGVRDLIARKVRLLALSEANLKSHIPAARHIFSAWPTPIVVAGAEIGDSVLFPAAALEKDFAWSQAHPVVDAYRAARPMPYDAPTWAMAPVLYAIRPKEGYFQLSDPGTISMLDDGRTKFVASADGRHRRLFLDPAQKERVLQAYIELASAKPVERTFRFRNQQKKDEPAKPPIN